jgi:hypothetical protein
MPTCISFETTRSVETKWGQALFRLCNCLTRRALIAQSLQSIMGATLTFLFTLKMFTRIPEVKFQGISALML